MFLGNAETGIQFTTIPATLPCLKTKSSNFVRFKNFTPASQVAAISFDDLKESEMFARVDDMVSQEGITQQDRLYRHRFVAALIKLLVEDFIVNSKENAAKYAQSEPISATLDATIPLPLGFSSQIATELKKLKKILFAKLYRHGKIARKMYAGKQCIRGLYKAFTQDSDLFPARQKELLDSRNRHRVIADYIASMTDRYAMKTYHDIYGLSL